jgi:hypothetical protein
MRRLLSVGLVGLFVLASVGSIFPTEPVVPADWSKTSAFPITIGWGWDDWQAYDDVGEIGMEEGFQGGQHIYVNLRAEDVAPGTSARTLAWLVRASDGEVLAGPEEWDWAWESADDAYVQNVPDGVSILYGPRIIIDSPGDIEGVEVELRVQTEVDGGRIGRAWATGTGVWLPAPWDEPLDGGPFAPRGDAGPDAGD